MNELCTADELQKLLVRGRDLEHIRRNVVPPESRSAWDGRPLTVPVDVLKAFQALIYRTSNVDVMCIVAGSTI